MYRINVYDEDNALKVVEILANDWVKDKELKEEEKFKYIKKYYIEKKIYPFF